MGDGLIHIVHQLDAENERHPFGVEIVGAGQADVGAVIVVGDQGTVWTTVPSCTDVRAPTTIEPLSPRSTVVAHTELCSPMVTSPMITASGCTKAVSAIVGVRSPRA